jgi:hypothetical protein
MKKCTATVNSICVFGTNGTAFHLSVKDQKWMCLKDRYHFG